MATASEYNVETLPISDIFVVGDRRAVSEQAVAALAESIDRIGLRTPITVRVDDAIPDPETGEVMGGFAVVTGAHRLAAFKLLGRDSIPAIVRDCDEDDARLWEIDENLCRAELSEAEEAQHIAARKDIWARIQKRRAEESGKTLPTLTGRGNTGFAADTAAATGQSKRTVNLKVERGEKIAPDVLKSITGTRWDKGVNLDILKKLSHLEQRQAMFRVNSGSSSSLEEAYDFIRGAPAAAPKIIKPAIPLNDFETVDKQVAALMAAWNRASKEAREDFLSRIDAPVMDKRFA